MKSKAHRCCECGKLATWHNMNPKNGNGLYYCDDCVPRDHAPFNIEDWRVPTSKNVVWWDKSAKMKDFRTLGSSERTQNSFYYDYIGKDGRRIPSTSFIHCNSGFFKCVKEKYQVVSDFNLEYCFDKTLERYSFTNRDKQRLKFDFNSVLLSIKKDSTQTLIEYNLFMSKLGDLITRKINNGLFHGKEEELDKFFRKLKSNAKKMV